MGRAAVSTLDPEDAMQPEPDASRAGTLRASVSAVILDSQGRLLLQRRSDNGRWGLPGGSVEVGESVSAAIAREVREETGLETEIVRLVGVYSDPRLQVVRYGDGNVVHYVSIFFQCRVLDGVLQTCEETLELAFFAPDELPGDLLPMHRVRIADALAGREQAFVR
jgi:ADP-ribose pyrophosphatase YjhB (NUDIX family)